MSIRSRHTRATLLVASVVVLASCSDSWLVKTSADGTPVTLSASEPTTTWLVTSFAAADAFPDGQEWTGRLKLDATLSAIDLDTGQADTGEAPEPEVRFVLTRRHEDIPLVQHSVPVAAGEARLIDDTHFARCSGDCAVYRELSIEYTGDQAVGVEWTATARVHSELATSPSDDAYISLTLEPLD